MPSTYWGNMYRVIEWSTGKVGKQAVIGIASHPDLELVGLWAHSPDRLGRDAGELTGIAPLGVAATSDADALLALDADCVCYTSASYSRVEESVQDVERMLRAGKNVVTTANTQLVWPQGLGGTYHDRLQAACLDGGTSFYTWGIDPGFGCVGSALAALSMSQSVTSVRIGELINYSTWDDPYVMTLFGFGAADTSGAPLLHPGVLTAVWGSSVEMVASALGIELDELVEFHEVAYADEDFDITAGHVAAGTIAAMRFEVRGMVGDHAPVVLHHTTRLRDQDAPDWEQGDGYRVQILGEPNIRLELNLSSDAGSTVHAAYVATAMPVVNAIPAVCDAAPGIITFLDLVPTPSRNVVLPVAAGQ